MMGLLAVIFILTPQVRNGAQALPKTKIPKISDIFKVFTTKPLLIVCLAIFAEFIMSQGVIYTMYPLYAKENLGLTLTEIGLIQGARSAGYVLAMLTMGSISDRVGRKPVLIAGMVSTAVLVVILGYISGVFPIAGLIFILGATTGTIWIISPVLASESVAPEYRGAAIGTYRTFFDLGSIFGPLIIMWVMTAYGSIYCFYVASALLIITLIPILTLKETRSTRPSV
jgi:MFS family permease